MDLSNFQRLKKLLSNLVANPDLIIPYLRQSIFYKGLPVDLGLPWWSYRAIEKVDEIAPGRRIFEYGTGGSTLRYGKVAMSICCVEDDLGWMELISGKLADAAVDAEIKHVFFDFNGNDDFLGSDYLHSADGIDWDLMIIDGQDKDRRARLACFSNAEKFAKAGSVIVVDDFWRYESLLSENRASRVEVFESVGPCRIGVTSTAIFYY